MSQPTATEPRRSLAWTGWAVFLGMSWTWCIGMYLPVSIVRALGIAGFVAFAVPNVLGGALLGWTLKSGQSSRQFVVKHERACLLFSMATIAFHAFFAAWMLPRVIGPGHIAHVAGAVLAAQFWILWILVQWPGGKILGALLTLAVSLGAIAWGMARGDIPYVTEPMSLYRLPPIGTLWLALALCFGFLLCPYLDLTFHAARQATPFPKAAFSVGFAGFFLAMILFTLGYSGWLAGPFEPARHPQLAFLLAAHFIAQSAFTCAIHTEELSRRMQRIRIVDMAGFLILMIAAAALATQDGGRPVYHELQLGEVVYRCFLGFYAVVFPAYVWLRAIGKPRGGWILVAAILLAMPCFWLGFVEEHLIYIVPGVAIMLAARLVPAPHATAV